MDQAPDGEVVKGLSSQGIKRIVFKDTELSRVSKRLNQLSKSLRTEGQDLRGLQRT